MLGKRARKHRLALRQPPVRAGHSGTSNPMIAFRFLAWNLAAMPPSRGLTGEMRVELRALRFFG